MFQQETGQQSIFSSFLKSWKRFVAIQVKFKFIVTYVKVPQAMKKGLPRHTLCNKNISKINNRWIITINKHYKTFKDNTMTTSTSALLQVDVHESHRLRIKSVFIGMWSFINKRSIWVSECSVFLSCWIWYYWSEHPATQTGTYQWNSINMVSIMFIR